MVNPDNWFILYVRRIIITCRPPPLKFTLLNFQLCFPPFQCNVIIYLVVYALLQMDPFFNGINDLFIAKKLSLPQKQPQGSKDIKVRRGDATTSLKGRCEKTVQDCRDRMRGSFRARIICVKNSLGFSVNWSIPTDCIDWFC